MYPKDNLTRGKVMRVKYFILSAFVLIILTSSIQARDVGSSKWKVGDMRRPALGILYRVRSKIQSNRYIKKLQLENESMQEDSFKIPVIRLDPRSI
tara:strand:- start:323 stop:610 length:288 start_codon:yes stop_codon:yes gene_type:complete